MYDLCSDKKFDQGTVFKAPMTYSVIKINNTALLPNGELLQQIKHVYNDIG